MRTEFYYPSMDGVTKIHAIEWKPDCEVRAVVQISHGMVEYIARYEEFADYLCKRGYYVVGQDHLGHGASVRAEKYHGYFHSTHGNAYVIGDIHRLYTMTRKKYPDKPYFMLGHSMGSFLIRQYITMRSEELSGAIIVGTGTQTKALLRAGKALCRSLARKKGDMYRSPLIDRMAFGAFNKRFEKEWKKEATSGADKKEALTGVEWLSRRRENIDAYVKDPWCGFTFTVNAYYHMFCGIEKAQDPGNMKRINKSLPLLFVSGEEDPVGDFGKGVSKAFDAYRKIGIHDVQMNLYPKDRHEILNEVDRNDVFRDIYHWLEEHIR